jgi:hypothetical protein
MIEKDELVGEIIRAFKRSSPGSDRERSRPTSWIDEEELENTHLIEESKGARVFIEMYIDK